MSETKPMPDDPKPSAKRAADPAPAPVRKLRLVQPYGFIDENGRHRSWNAGDVVADPAETALLTERKAPCEPVD